MADKKSEPAKSRRKPAATTTTEAAAPGAARVLPDIRRVLPTQDWIARVDRVGLGAVAISQILAASHFYPGLVRLRADLPTRYCCPPLRHQLPRQRAGGAAAGRWPGGDARGQCAPVPRCHQGHGPGASDGAHRCDSKPDQATADDYAAEIVKQNFGAQGVPIDTAYTLFTNYRRFVSGNSGPLTRGSIAFLKALGLAPDG